MAIKEKTRKTLWARSGNRCAMCRAELVAEKDNHDCSLNLGDECHIISEKNNGPRHSSNYDKDYDDYENLILLCKNHHRTIDELWETYSVELLKKIKRNHESWIKDVIDKADNKIPSPKILQRITTGKQIVDIIRDVAGYQFDHDEFKSQEETSFVSEFLQNIQEWGEASGSADFEIGRQVQLAFDLNKDLKELEKRGFFLFGERKRSKIINANKDNLGIWDIAVLVVLSQESPQIIKQ